MCKILFECTFWGVPTQQRSVTSEMCVANLTMIRFFSRLKLKVAKIDKEFSLGSRFRNNSHEFAYDLEETSWCGTAYDRYRTRTVSREYAHAHEHPDHWTGCDPCRKLNTCTVCFSNGHHSCECVSVQAAWMYCRIARKHVFALHFPNGSACARSMMKAVGKSVRIANIDMVALFCWHPLRLFDSTVGCSASLSNCEQNVGGTSVVVTARRTRCIHCICEDVHLRGSRKSIWWLNGCGRSQRLTSMLSNVNPESIFLWKCFVTMFTVIFINFEIILDFAMSLHMNIQ